MYRITLPKKNIKVLRVQQLIQDNRSSGLVKKPLKTARFELEFIDDDKFEAWAKNVAKMYLDLRNKKNRKISQSEVC